MVLAIAIAPPGAAGDYIVANASDFVLGLAGSFGSANLDPGGATCEVQLGLQRNGAGDFNTQNGLDIGHALTLNLARFNAANVLQEFVNIVGWLHDPITCIWALLGPASVQAVAGLTYTANDYSLGGAIAILGEATFLIPTNCVGILWSDLVVPPLWGGAGSIAGAQITIPPVIRAVFQNADFTSVPAEVLENLQFTPCQRGLYDSVVYTAAAGVTANAHVVTVP